MRIPSLAIAIALIAASAIASDLVITSLERNGTLTWTNSVSNAVYQVQWANSVTGGWSNFQSLAALDTVQSTAKVVSVKVPTFYRVAASEPPTWKPDGLYRYTAFDTNGNLLVVGWWEVKSPTNTVFGNIAGQWVMGYAGRLGGGYQDTGPQLGRGELQGKISVDRILVGLNPNVSDDDVGIFGDFAGTSYTGEWRWSSYGGLKLGEFTLEKVNGVP